jgi:hypothetical protein
MAKRKVFANEWKDQRAALAWLRKAHRKLYDGECGTIGFEWPNLPATHGPAYLEQYRQAFQVVAYLRRAKPHERAALVAAWQKFASMEIVLECMIPAADAARILGVTRACITKMVRQNRIRSSGVQDNEINGVELLPSGKAVLSTTCRISVLVHSGDILAMLATRAESQNGHSRHVKF